MCMIRFFVLCFVGLRFLYFFPNSRHHISTPHGYKLTLVGALTFAHAFLCYAYSCYGFSMLCYALKGIEFGVEVVGCGLFSMYVDHHVANAQ